MFPAKFEYVRAASVQEAIDLLQQGNGDAKIMAGGHSLLPLMKLRLAQPGLLIDIGRIPELKFIRVDGDALVVGALATYRDAEFSADVKRVAPVVADTVKHIGDMQVRARGTLVGGLAHADPAGDLPAVVLALGATVHAVGPQGTRDIAIDEFFVDMLTTALDEREIITEVRIQGTPAGVGAAYQKFDQPASHYALTGVCARVQIGPSGDITDARIGITGVASKAYRPMAVEQALRGVDATDEAAVTGACQAAADGVDVQGDLHASPEYRAHLARVLTRRAVLQAAAEAQR